FLYIVPPSPSSTLFPYTTLFRSWLRFVGPVHRTPVHAIWIGALLAFLSTLYTPAFLTLAAGCAVFLYISYAMPVAAGLVAEGRRSEEHTSELQSRFDLVCRLLLE